MKNEPIPFKTENNNAYFYDPVLKEIFIYNKDLYDQRQSACQDQPPEPYRYEPITPELVQYQLANLTQVTIEMTEKCNLNCLYCTYGNLYSTVQRKGTDINFNTIKHTLDYLVEKLNSNLNPGDFSQTSLSKKESYARSALNINLNGEITVLPDGKILPCERIEHRHALALATL